ncbi:MAG: transglutaminase domain-containing protein [Desulfohalobiaceae bacterium]
MQKDRSRTIKRVRYGFIVENPTSHVVRNATLWVYAPMKRTATQRCRKIQASSEFRRIRADRGHQILRFRFAVVPPYGSRQVTVRAELNMTSQPQSLPDKEMEAWLIPGPFVQSEADAIESRASQLRADTEKQTLREILSWVNSEIRYTGYSRRERGALNALQYGKGDCTEFADLYAALARSCGIPSRVVTGFVHTGSGMLRPSMYHNWVEAFCKSSWRLTDPQKGVFDNHSSRYIAMSILGRGNEHPISRGRLYSVEGEGLEVSMK